MLTVIYFCFWPLSYVYCHIILLMTTHFCLLSYNSGFLTAARFCLWQYNFAYCRLLRPIQFPCDYTMLLTAIQFYLWPHDFAYTHNNLFLLWGETCMPGECLSADLVTTYLICRYRESNSSRVGGWSELLTSPISCKINKV